MDGGLRGELGSRESLCTLACCLVLAALVILGFNFLLARFWHAFGMLLLRSVGLDFLQSGYLLTRLFESCARGLV